MRETGRLGGTVSFEASPSPPPLPTLAAVGDGLLVGLSLVTLLSCE